MEQEGAMNITDELREWASVEVPYKYGHQLTAIADRIDEEHERVCNEQYACGAEHGIGASIEASMIQDHGYIELPKDADGEYIHIGDMMVSKDGKVHRVDSLTRNPTWFDYEWSIRLALLNDGVGAGSLVRYRPDTLRHYHAPTVEDVLEEFVARWLDTHHDDLPSLKAEYAAKLRLAGDAE